MSLQILIADDEAPARARLRALVEELGHEVCACVSNGSDALRALEDARIDAALLDIEMPGTDGLSLAAQLAREYPGIQVILVTAHPEYALRAFDAAVVDYLLKPVRKERLARSFDRVQKQQAHTTSPVPLLHITIGRRERVIPITDIDCFIADEGHVLARSAKLTGFTDMPLREIEERWRPYVVRVHRSCLAVISAIAGIERTDSQDHALLFRDEFPAVPISRRRLAEVRQRLRQH